MARLPDEVRDGVESVLALALSGAPSRAALLEALLRLATSAVTAQAG